MRVTFDSGGLRLEGDWSAPAEPLAAAVVCHPHPQYGGDMDNAVVCTVATVLQQAGVATLRFNFRGVGGSQGTYGGGAGEIEDARAAAAYVMARTGLAAVTLAGYSFGAMVALRLGADWAAAERLIAVAPPLSFFDLAALAHCERPKLFVVGDRDAYCGVRELDEQLAGVAAPTMQRIIPGADHFFVGHGSEIAAAVRSFLDATVTDAR